MDRSKIHVTVFELLEEGAGSRERRMVRVKAGVERSMDVSVQDSEAVSLPSATAGTGWLSLANLVEDLSILFVDLVQSPPFSVVVLWDSRSHGRSTESPFFFSCVQQQP